ncbi:DUF6624 domain-containing protein [Sphingobacterium sp. MYb382]|uniref:DUF6624 domain-containing protein n=1 Tax=Sphingobacterium sp. MYb382 TaxID=2745278 RepID=UPI0030976AD9
MHPKIISFAIGIIFLLASCHTTKNINDSTRKQMQEELRAMVKIDQVAAFQKQGVYKDYSEEAWQSFKDSVFQTNQKNIARYFAKYGFLGFKEVGEESSQHFWLLVQHCDHDPKFQKRVLAKMDKEIKKKNAKPENYAYLFDRVQINAGEKQQFGTQVTYLAKTTGRAIPKIGLVDSIHVDQRRAMYNLPPLKKYLNDMTKLHFQMNKDSYEKNGYTAPDLYSE